MRRWKTGLLVSLVMALACMPALAAPRFGRAVIINVRGQAMLETGGQSMQIEEGFVLMQGQTLRTGQDSSLCAVLTPGAVLCVDENASVLLSKLEHVTEGLPGEGKATRNVIVLDIEKGAILVNGERPAPDLSIEAHVSPGIVIASAGGKFVISKANAACAVYAEEKDLRVTVGKKTDVVAEGRKMELAYQRGAAGSPGEWVPSVAPIAAAGVPYDFHVCRSFFPSLEPYVEDWSWDDLEAINDSLETPRALTFINTPSEWLDVSTAIRAPENRNVSVTGGGHQRGRVGGLRPRWEMWEWQRGVGAVRGVNYVPRYAVNAIEMWRADTFNPELIDEELGWAADSGHNSVRVFLPFVVWEIDADGLKKRMDRFLSLADKHGMSTVFVLFDDTNPSGKEPRAGKQDPPVPGVHNSQWIPSPGRDRVLDKDGAWTGLETYVKDVVRHFEGDDRVLMWDLYNDPGHSDMGSESLPLVEAAFGWARAVDPEQPLTAGLGRGLDRDSLQRVLRLCDVITFTAYESVSDLEAKLMLAEVRGRPVYCTGWLSRARGNTFQTMLPLFASHRVGWYHWGLVAGRTQTYMPWASRKGASMPNVWEQDLLTETGEPFDAKEIELIKGFAFDAL